MGRGSRKRRARRKREGKQPARPRPPLNPTRPGAKPSPVVVALAGAFCVLVFGLAPLLQGGYMLAGALGLVGHRAVFTAAGCHMTGTGKNRHNVCEGELVEAHRPQRYASIAADVPLDRATPVQVLPTGWLETVGPAAVTGWSTLGLGGLTGLTAASLAVFRGRVKPPSHSIGRRLFVVLASLTLTGLVVYVVVRAVT